MSAITFDPFKCVEKLTKSGLAKEQAEAISDAIKEANADLSDHTNATKKRYIGH